MSHEHDFMDEYETLVSKFNPREDCPDCIPKLPCGCPKPWDRPYGKCSLNDPLMMVIPPDGVHISCPVHPGGHHIYGNHFSCSQEIDLYKNHE